MAGVRETFELVDRATAPLRNIQTAMGNVYAQFNQVNVQINNYVSAQQRSTDAMRAGTSAASGFSVALGKLAGAFLTLRTLQGAIRLSDELSLAQTRLGNINDGLQTTAELQNMIYQSAQRSRGAYLGMMQTVASLKAQTGDTFASVQEAVAFTELLQKQFKIAGTDATGIASTMYNLTQALSTGVLRGQDLNIVMSNAPQIAQRIAKYLNVSVGEMKELASKGQITSAVVKNALLGAADEINEQFDKMPMTFGDAMIRIQNLATRAFEPIGQMMADAINTQGFEDGINAIGTALYVVAGIFIGLTSAVTEGLATIGGWISNLAVGFGGLGNVFVTVAGVLVGAFFMAVDVVVGFFIEMYNTILIIVAAVVNGWNLGIHAIQKAIYDFAKGAIDGFSSVAQSADNAATAIANAFIAGANAAIGGINKLIEALNSIPGVSLSTVGEVGQVEGFGFADAVKAAAEGLEALKPGDVPEVWTPETVDIANPLEAYDIGKEMGEDWAKNLLDGLGDATDFGSFGDLSGAAMTTPGGGLMPNGGNVGKVGKVKSVDNVKLSDEDRKIYRDLAERRYLNNIELRTLAPEINVTLPAGASGNLSAQDVADRLKKMLIEQMAAQTAVAHG